MAIPHLTPLIAHDVQITDNNGHVDQDSVTISRAAGDEVTWTAHGAKKAIIVFASPDGSPFHDTTFHVPASGSVSSGPIKATAAYKSYKYIVVGETGSNDPVVIIKN